MKKKYQLIRDFMQHKCDDFVWLTEWEANLIDNAVILVEQPFPIVGSVYFYISSKGCVEKKAYENSTNDRKRQNFGNCFKTREEAAIKKKLWETVFKTPLKILGDNTTDNRYNKRCYGLGECGSTHCDHPLI